MKVTITKITAHKRFKQRYHLFFNKGNGEEYGFSIDEDVLIKRGIKKGLEIDQEELEQIVDEDEKKKTYHLSIHYLSYRMRSVFELVEYLQGKERKKEHIEYTVQLLLEQKLLNDEEFAKSFVRTKKNTQLKGPLKLKQELKQKGISEAIIEGALREFSFAEQIEKLTKWLMKQKPSMRESAHALKQKQQNRLQAKGFSHAVIQIAYDEVDADLDNDSDQDAEWQALCFQAEKLKRKYKTKYNTYEYEQKLKQGLYQKGFPIDEITRFIEKDKENETF
ncbi:recombinase RecX [Alkalihalobacillus alcalophilus ATCC 27647 = CGMCC 1.3604]|uniref:Regulatory protein RecX n=1 Tax=Alkalihalobacillus alcalophilus ATCC 27647 = CGMCC 1.3604 TaxID=1218173 RepID=A0A094WP09_ALKAL|nr:recombination regulator RecX [Alkalihalobacillus alcalophilus]KGA97698.1 recombinase RecX [Alkalihalobacillus alcalophilus ATCC 27647 = CGMCC 1.3604]MED1562575.1 recombination regulator RecX [Alkalihalobacillus alcalophilus]THG91268.1 recombinase RecX [Alkalihalobacillus alcalophilus ATCC 27647 = CGMCC 1.3604]